MPFIFHCPYCQSPMTVPDELAGTAAACAGCRRPITLPAGPPVPAAPQPVQPAAQLPTYPPQAPQVVPPQPPDANPIAYEALAGQRRKRRQRSTTTLALLSGGLAVLVLVVMVGVLVLARSGRLGFLQGAKQYEGEWGGATSAGGPLSFAVKNGDVQVSILTAPWDAVHTGSGWEGPTGFFALFLLGDTSVGPVGAHGSFSGSVSVPADGMVAGGPAVDGAAGHTITLEGRFTSSRRAAGRCTIDGTAYEWSAEKGRKNVLDPHQVILNPKP